MQVNVGLTLEAMTDGLCKANVHRVIFPKAVENELPKNRKTIAYFSTPSHDVVRSCTPNTERMDINFISQDHESCEARRFNCQTRRYVVKHSQL